MASYEDITQIDFPNERTNMFALEGLDGSGKTTQSYELIRYFEGLGIKATRVTSPSEGMIGTFVRNNMRKLESWERNALFLMDFIHTLRQHPDNDKVLIWDRYIASGHTSNKDMTLEEAINWLSILPEPTQTYLLDIDPVKVVTERGESVHDHSSDIGWQEFKRKRYESLCDLFPNQISIIDATGSKNDITERIGQDIISRIVEG